MLRTRYRCRHGSILRRAGERKVQDGEDMTRGLKKVRRALDPMFGGGLDLTLAQGSRHRLGQTP